MKIEHWWFTAPLRLKSIFRRRRADDELDEELRFHLDHKIEEGIAEGLSPEEARYRALRAMGGLDQKKEEMRDARRVHWLTDFVDDVRYAVRSLRRTPGLTAFVVVTIALGIGMTATPLSMLDALIFRPYPVPRPGDVVTLVSTSRDNGFDSFSYREYLDIRDQAKSYDGVVANAQPDDRRLQRRARRDAAGPGRHAGLRQLLPRARRRAAARARLPRRTRTRRPAATPWWSSVLGLLEARVRGRPVRRRPGRPAERHGLHRHRRRAGDASRACYIFDRPDFYMPLAMARVVLDRADRRTSSRTATTAS